MLPALLIGSLVLAANLAIQVFAVVMVIRLLLRRYDKPGAAGSVLRDFGTIGGVLFMLFAGHLMQFSTWALVFIWLGEFTDFATAFYHSVVNFATLGYGDIVMSEKWRLLGALEAANGSLMFGLSAGSLLPVMFRLFKSRLDAVRTRED